MNNNTFNNCTNCPYSQTITTLSPIGIENNGSSTLLVFQSPGNDEWTRKTISGKRIPIDSISPHSAANRMRKSFVRKKVLRTSYDITEAVKCYPGKGKKRDKKPKKDAISICEQYLENDIINNHYTKIVCFGEIAYDMVDSIVRKNNIQVNYVKAPHPSSGVSNDTLNNSY